MKIKWFHFLPKQDNKYPNNCFEFAQIQPLAIDLKRLMQLD